MWSNIGPISFHNYFISATLWDFLVLTLLIGFKSKLWMRRALYGCSACVSTGAHLAIWSSVNPVMVDSPLIPQGDGPLSGAALALPDQEAPVDPRTKQILCGVAWHGSVVPAVLLQAVDWSDVVGRHPTLAIFGLCLAPLPVVVVTQHTQLLPCSIRKSKKDKKYCTKYVKIKSVKEKF